MEKIKLLNTYVDNFTMEEAIDKIEMLIAGKKKSYVVAVNVDVIMKIEQEAKLKHITDSADVVLVDGMPLVWISKLHKKPIVEKISGSDLVPKLCGLAAQKGYSIFLIGGKDGIAEQAKRKLERNTEDYRLLEHMLLR